MKIRNTLFLLFFCTIITITTIPAIIIIDAFFSESKEQVILQMHVDSEHILDKISRVFYERNSDIEIFAHQGSSIFVNGNVDSQKLGDFINKLRLLEKSKKTFVSISVYDEHGLKIADTRNFEIGVDNDADEPFFISALGGEYYQDPIPILSSETNREVIHFSAPLYDEDEAKAVLVARMPTSRVYDIIASAQEFHPDVENHLFSRDGNLIYSTMGTTGMNLSVLDDFKKSGIRSDIIGNSLYSVHVEKSFLGKPTSDWYLISQIDTKTAFASITDARNNLFGIVGAVTLLIVLLIIYLSKLLSDPITSLRDASAKIADGDFTFPLPSNSKIDEVKDLSNSFKVMKQNLRFTINELRNTISKLHQADIEKGGFLSMVSHEMKTPLMPILGYAEMLKSPNLIGNLNEKQIDAVDDIFRNGQILEKLISDFLDLHKSELNQLKLGYSKVSTTDVFNETIRDVAPSVKSIGTILEIDYLHECHFECDKMRLKQVLKNLIINAIDFIPEKTGKIQVGVKDSGNNLEFHVFDNGLGISKEKIDLIFEKFYQIDQSFRREHGGSGLGLSICKGIITALGGKIWVQSSKDVGTKFYFTVPKRRPTNE